MKDVYREIDAQPMPQALFGNLSGVIGQWPDLSFTTPDGRCLCLAEFGDSICHRLHAANTQLTPKQEKWLSAQAGVIVDSEGDPLIFEDGDALRDAWFELHALFGIKPTPDDCGHFDWRPESTDDSDSDDSDD